MIIIAFEGLDKAGKHTQMTMLYDFLVERGINVEKISFPVYDTPTGKLIRSYLEGNYPIDNHTFELLMAADKYAQQKYIYDLSEKNVDVLLLDRYILSQYVYGMANQVDLHWLKQVLSNIVEPDITIYLDIQAEESIKRKGKFEENDKYENDLEFLNQVRINYLKFVLQTEEVRGVYSSPIFPISASQDREAIQQAIHLAIRLQVASFLKVAEAQSEKGD